MQRRVPSTVSTRTHAVEMPSLAEIEAAEVRIRDVIVHTPLVPLHAHGRPGDLDDARAIWIKPEILQPAGSFKVRGIYHATLQLGDERRACGLSTVSAGNTAKALAWCARRFGVAARSLMPESAPATKVEAVRALGATPVLVPTAEVFRFLRESGWEHEPFAFVHPWTNRDVILGHASLGLEIARDLPDVETVYVPVGGGGLFAGVASALKRVKPAVRVVAVEPAGCPSFHAALRAGHPVTVDCNTMCDGVAVPYVTEEMFPLLRALADDAVLVSEEEVRAAIRLLASANHVIAEGAGALATAAALSAPIERRGRSVAIVTGGSIDTSKLVEILAERPANAPR
jgi:threonine dehydratase